MPPKKAPINKEFVWSDDEVQLLLETAADYKAAKEAECVDWESVKTKYKDIFELFIAALLEDNTNPCKNFPHKKDDMKLQTLTSKLKAIRLKFRQAVDSGRRSGHGRVVMIYHELCERVWGGSPATEQIDAGIETVELEDGQSTVKDNTATTTTTSNSSSSESTQADSEVQAGSEQDLNGERSNEIDGDSTHVPQDTTVKWQQFLDGKLRNYKHEKRKRKLPVDTQLLNCAQEELAIKKRLLEQVDKMDQRYAENVEKMSQNMERLTNSIADGFMMLQRMMTFQQLAPMYHPQPYSPYNMQGSNSGMSSYTPSPSDPNYQ